MTYPAPMMAPYDEWFNEPIMTETQMEYDRLYAVKEEEDVVLGMEPETKSKEPEDIHEIMYQMSQGNWNTVIESQGGSEHFHEGPGGWNSGTGMGQFR